MANVVGYVRASTTEQDQTIKAQVEKIEAYCKLRGLTLVNVYVDFGVSGTVPLEEREKGSQMLQALKGRTKDKPVGIVAIRLDRMFRNASDCLVNVEAWEKQGVSLHLIDLGGQSVDTSTAAGKFFITVIAGAAEMERNLISERTSAVLQSKKRRGEVFNHTPYGYDRDGNRLEENPQEQAILQTIRSMREGGLAYNKIAKALNDQGIKGKNGGMWGSETVRKVLTAA